MGNNHDKYFGSDKRKILLLGLQSAGKTTFLQYVSKSIVNLKTQKTKNLNIQDVKINNLSVSFFDLGGGERQRVFWKQQYEGTQGIIFVISATFSPEQNKKSLQQLEKLIKQLTSDIPIAIGISKVDLVHSLQWSKFRTETNKYLQQKYKKQHFKAFELDYNNKESIKTLLEWFLNITKPI